MKNQIFKLNTPVLFLVFNRLETTKKVFSEIKRVKPSKLFIASDGPRNSEEEEIIKRVRNYILDNISWKCDVKTLFRDKNLGCKYAVSSAINWFFENVEQGIILEDDCLPSQSFFRFCQEMLIKYKDNNKITHISGTNVEESSEIQEDYFFSNFFNVWGWATWKRAWEKYDVKMNEWPKWRIKCLRFMKNYPLITKIKSIRLYELTYRNKINTWDYQWDFISKKDKSLCIIPKYNLITNLGFNFGTHTTNYNKDEKSLKRYNLNFPLKENNFLKNRETYSKKYINFFKPKFILKVLYN